MEKLHKPLNVVWHVMKARTDGMGVYALVHEFLDLVMGRFIWALDCGKKERQLFEKTMKTFATIASNTGDLSLFTDGERR